MPVTITSLSRSDADRGTHEFTYSLLLHTGDLIRSNVTSQASALNHPPLVVHEFGVSSRPVPIQIEGAGATIETIKKAEKENCLIVRIVETNGSHIRVVLHCHKSIKRIEECDLMEWRTVHKMELTDNLTITFDPFEIKTFKLWQE